MYLSVENYVISSQLVSYIKLFHYSRISDSVNSQRRTKGYLELETDSKLDKTASMVVLI